MKLFEKLKKWWRRTWTNRLEEDWRELIAMSDDALCREVMEAGLRMDMSDRALRARSVAALRFCAQHLDAKIKAAGLNPEDAKDTNGTNWHEEKKGLK